MFNSTVLEVGIGILFCFTAVSLIVSSLNEAISSVLNLRGNNLLDGIKQLLNDPNASGLVLSLYNHAGANPLGSGTAASAEDLTYKPSYMGAATFAQAMVDILQKAGDGKQTVATAITNLTDPQLKKMLTDMYQRADGDLLLFEQHMASWFNNGMDRVSGIYKRRIQLITVLLGLAIAMAFNIDFFRLFRVLWEHPALAQGISSANAGTSMQALDLLKPGGDLPVGWTKSPFCYRFPDLLAMLPGWLVTASSTLFGASFWFDILQKATNLRSTGPKNDKDQKA